ncbi:Transamidase GatB domain protein [hydrothermal vent metagenome]|uniref:Transamidase GatB domain protein n=1 Tax=hydrothermal vent metagenome TaxID=652676 RepID=A0A3B1B6G5_9ZZZZ
MSTATLTTRITDDVKAAMRSKDKSRLAVLRLITAAIKQIEVDQRITLDDDQVVGVLEKMLKQRKDSIEQFSKAGRDELVAQEAAEIEIIQEYLPEQLSEDELSSLINDAISATNAASMKDMGKVMGLLKPQLAGRADMGQVSQTIKQRLSS